MAGTSFKLASTSEVIQPQAAGYELAACWDLRARASTPLWCGTLWFPFWFTAIQSVAFPVGTQL